MVAHSDDDVILHPVILDEKVEVAKARKCVENRRTQTVIDVAELEYGAERDENDAGGRRFEDSFKLLNNASNMIHRLSIGYDYL